MSPEPTAELPPDAQKKRGTIVWHVLLALDLGQIGLNIILGLALYILFVVQGPAPATESALERFDGNTLLWINNIVAFLTFGVIPFLWVLGTRVKPWEGTLRYLKLEDPWPAIGHGLGYAALLAGLVLFMILMMDVFGWQFEDTGTSGAFSEITWTLVIVTSLVAGITEEILFRGVLQRFVGVWLQALIFGLAHIANGFVPFLLTGAIGLLFGMLVKNGRSMWLVITAHVVYDIILLGASKLGAGAIATTFGV